MAAKQDVGHGGGDILVLAGKLHHAAYVAGPGRYFVQRLLQLSTAASQVGRRRGGGGGHGANGSRGQEQRECWT